MNCECSTSVPILAGIWEAGRANLITCLMIYFVWSLTKLLSEKLTSDLIRLRL